MARSPAPPSSFTATNVPRHWARYTCRTIVAGGAQCCPGCHASAALNVICSRLPALRRAGQWGTKPGQSTHLAIAAAPDLSDDAQVAVPDLPGAQSWWYLHPRALNASLQQLPARRLGCLPL